MRSFALVTALILASCERFSSSEETSRPPDAGIIVREDGGLLPPERDGPDGAIDGGADIRNDDQEDAAAGNVMGCATFVDRTLPDASRSLTWDFTFPITEERCLEVRVGQSIRFTDGAGQAARFDIHSVQPSGGDHPNPIDQLDLQTGSVTLRAPGTFGFLCVDHRSMRGAVRAVP